MMAHGTINSEGEEDRLELDQVSTHCSLADLNHMNSSFKVMRNERMKPDAIKFLRK